MSATKISTYQIKFIRFAPRAADTTGYSPNDFLEDYADQEFETLQDARDWVRQHYRGPDCEGVDAHFNIVDDFSGYTSDTDIY